MTFDSIAVGEAQAQYLVDKATGTGQPLYLYAGAASDNNAFLFFEGAWNKLQPKIADGTARAIADAFAADKDVTSYVVTGQDAEKASVQYIIDGKQSMTVLKDVRTLVGDAIAAAIAYLTGGVPEQTNTYNNGVIDVPAKPSVVIAVDKDNLQAAIIDSGYWPASDYTGLP